MKYSLYHCFFIIIFFVSCRSNQTNEKISQTEKHQQEVKDYQEAVSTSLLEIIKAFIAHNDSSHNIDSNLSHGIYGVSFYKENQSCFFLIGAALYYKSNEIDGCIYINNDLVVFYNINACAINGLIDQEKLGNNNDIEGYPNERTYIHSTFEPSGNKYEIHSKDSIKLIYSGYF